MTAPFRIDLTEIEERAGRLARFLARHTDPDDRVAVLAENSPEFVIARLGATAAGRTLVPVNPKLTAPEVAYVLDHAGAALLLATPALLATARAAGAARVVATGDATADPAMPLATATGSTLIYTSGTTGYPKGCLRDETAEAARAAELTGTYGITAADVHLIACPLAHSAPGILLRAGLTAGAETWVMPRFDAEEFLRAVADVRASFFFLVPTQYERLLALPADVRARCDISSIRCALVAGAPIAAATKRRLVDWLGEGRLWEFYGSSETGTVTVLPPAEQLTRPGSVGRPPAGVELRLVDEGGNDVAVGEVGEIYVRSPTLMTGYRQPDGSVRRPAARGGFISVGDLGRCDDDGYLYLVDRKHDTIISGGVNVYPAEVERALAALPEVRGAVVFGVADPDWGQIVATAVAVEPPPDDPVAYARGLRQRLRGQLAGFKLPRAVAIIGADALPIGSSGKPLRRRARAELTDALIRL